MQLVDKAFEFGFQERQFDLSEKSAVCNTLTFDKRLLLVIAKMRNATVYLIDAD